MGRLVWQTLAVAALALFGSSLAERPQLSSSVLQSVEVRAHGHLQKHKDTANTTSPDCLCSFDIDRTLTGKQGDTGTCSKNKVIHGVHDSAYGKGDLTLSELGQNIGKTFCRKCYIAFVSAGNAGGPNSRERATLLEQAKASGGTVIADHWVGPSSGRGRRRNCGSDPKWYSSTLAVGCEDGSKQEAVKGMVAYLKQHKGATIDPSLVYHFDDRVDNIVSFHGTGFNARQISCKHMDGSKGLCGAQLAEIEESSKGCEACPPPSGCDPGGPVWNTLAGTPPSSCGGRIKWVRGHDHLSDDEARKKIAGEFPNECGACVEDETPPESVDGDGADLTDGSDESAQPSYEKFDNKKPRCDGNTDVDVAEFGSPKDMSPDACKTWCTEEEDCECVAYQKSKKKCWLAKKCGKDTWEDNSEFTIYYKIKSGDDDGGNPKYKTHLNTNSYPGHGGQDMGLNPKTNLSPEGCMEWCSDVDKCECATYHVSDKKCWLRTTCNPDMWQHANGYNVFEKLEDDGNTPSPSPRPTPRPHPNGGPKGPEGCKTATLSNGMEGCYRAADWARSTGVVKNPAIYKPATSASPFEDFQNFLHNDHDQQGCTVPACDPPPQQPPGVSVRVTPALDSRGYGKLRVSLVRYQGRPPADSGDVKWTYNKQFQHRWDGNHIKSAIVDVKPGMPQTFNMDGTDVTVRLPKKDDGIVALFMADPKYECDQGRRWNVLGVTQDIINGMSEMDYWSTIGDNWYDITGKYHKAVFSGLNLNGSQRLFSATMGNHDFIIRSLYADGLRGPSNNRDSFGYGHVQWYALDTISAKDNPAEPFNWAKKPWDLVDKSNTFFYHSVGNVFMIGFSNNYGWKAQESWFNEACQYAGKANPVIILLLGHWDGADNGCQRDATTPKIRDFLEDIPGCQGKRIKGIMGHRHENHVVWNKNWLIGGWGYDWGGHSDHRFGLPLLDTRGGKIRFIWFKLAVPHERIDMWDTISCLKEKGINGCMDKPKEIWFEEDI